MFSIIVPFLNEEKHIETCILSLISQDFPKNKYEILMVDNGSTDNSVKIINKYPQIKLLKETRRGDALARNKALSKAKGKYIAFTDADCLVTKNWLSLAQRSVTSSPCLLAMGNRQFPNTSVGLTLLQQFENFRARTILTGHNRSYYFGYTNNMIVAKDIFKKIGPFRNYRSYDTEWVARAISKIPSLKISYVSKMEIIHLEITTPWIWIKKFYEYGKSYIKMKQKGSSYEVVSDKKTFQIYQLLIRQYHYTIIQSLYLLFLLFIKSCSYKTGALVQRYLL